MNGEQVPGTYTNGMSDAQRQFFWHRQEREREAEEEFQETYADAVGVWDQFFPSNPEPVIRRGRHLGIVRGRWWEDPHTSDPRREADPDIGRGSWGLSGSNGEWTNGDDMPPKGGKSKKREGHVPKASEVVALVGGQHIPLINLTESQRKAWVSHAFAESGIMPLADAAAAQEVILTADVALEHAAEASAAIADVDPAIVRRDALLKIHREKVEANEELLAAAVLPVAVESRSHVFMTYGEDLDTTVPSTSWNAFVRAHAVGAPMEFHLEEQAPLPVYRAKAVIFAFLAFAYVNVLMATFMGLRTLGFLPMAFVLVVLWPLIRAYRATRRSYETTAGWVLSTNATDRFFREPAKKLYHGESADCYYLWRLQLGKTIALEDTTDVRPIGSRHAELVVRGSLLEVNVQRMRVCTRRPWGRLTNWALAFDKLTTWLPRLMPGFIQPVWCDYWKGTVVPGMMTAAMACEVGGGVDMGSWANTAQRVYSRSRGANNIDSLARGGHAEVLPAIRAWAAYNRSLGQGEDWGRLAIKVTMIY